MSTNDLKFNFENITQHCATPSTVRRINSSIPLAAAYIIGPGVRFSKVPETFRARKAIFSPSVSKNGEVYTPETSCMKGTSLHIKNM